MLNRNARGFNFFSERKQILFLSLLLFCVCFNYSMLKGMKDTVVVTASSAAVIPFIKVWALLPMSVLLTFVYLKMANRLSPLKVFHLITSAFLAFFFAFAFVLYPAGEAIHLTSLAEFLRTILPKGFLGFIAMIEFWSFTLFYIIAELWSTLVLSILTWGFVNEISNIKKAPKLYTTLSVVSNAAAIFAGLTANLFLLKLGKGEWSFSLQCMTLVIIVCGVLSMLVYHALTKNVIRHKKCASSKPVYSFSQSFKAVKNSSHLRYMAVIVVSYFFVMNAVEVVWKEQLHVAYPDAVDFNFYINLVTIGIGFISTFLGVFFAFFIKQFGWSKTALITPVIMLLTSLLFFVFTVFEADLIGVTSFLGTSPLAISVFLGALQNCLSKGAKYSVFDATKEMAFIPLPHHLKIKGKAIIDGVLSRSGKSGASFSLQVLIVTFGSLSVCNPLTTIFVLAVVFCWVVATKRLGLLMEPDKKPQLSTKSNEQLIESLVSSA